MKESSKKPNRKRRRILTAVLLLSCGYLALCALLAWGTVCRRPKQMTRTPAEFGLRYESIRFISADGTILRGWFLPANGRAKGVIVCCHGVDSTRLALLRPARALHRAGYAVLLFDFRARGESGGERCALGYRETDDLLAAVAWLKTRPDCRALPLGALGESMGGAVALMAAARNPAIQCVIAESPFARLDHAVSYHFQSLFGAGGPIFGVPTRWIGERLIGKNCAEIAPVAEISRIAPRPILLIADGDDRLCPPSETDLLFAAAGGAKQLWTVPNAGHIGAKSIQPAEYDRRITAFFDACLRAGSHGGRVFHSNPVSILREFPASNRAAASSKK